MESSDKVMQFFHSLNTVFRNSFSLKEGSCLHQKFLIFKKKVCGSFGINSSERDLFSVEKLKFR